MIVAIVLVVSLYGGQIAYAIGYSAGLAINWLEKLVGK